MFVACEIDKTWYQLRLFSPKLVPCFVNLTSYKHCTLL